MITLSAISLGFSLFTCVV